MKEVDYFDVLTIEDNLESVDIIQAFLGSKCLGTFFQNGMAKMYFNSISREEMEIKLKELCPGLALKCAWEKQTRKDWHLSWQDHFKPVTIENKLAIIPPWEKDHPAEITVKIKPGMAFGTGHHETTWLMLSQILKYMKLGMSVLDMGTGSGILSIVARKLGAGKIDAVENDAECETNFYKNLELNAIQRGIQFHHRDVLSWNRFDHDLILANINRDIIEKLIPRLRAGGNILLSGLLEKDFQDIEILCTNNKLQIKEKMIKGEWICLSVE